MMNTITTLQTLAPSITKAASQQTYYTIRFLADRDRIPDAFRAYAYFRWLDDTLDGEPVSARDRTAFLERQKSLTMRRTADCNPTCAT
jgi:phytoene/squalene synthetase